MNIFSMRTKERETYSVQIKYSLLWECALGIAAITNHSLVETLDLTKQNRERIKGSMTKEMTEHLEYVKTHNTWKTLLQLLHQGDFKNIADFTSFVKKLSSEELKTIAIPYLGKEQKELINQLIQGSDDALAKLQLITKENSFLPSYLKFISEVDTEALKSHLIEVMSGWYKAVIEPDEEELESILIRDMDAKEKMIEKLGPEEFVEWATDGTRYYPEPSVFQVLLIPQYIYRPWNVEADLEGVKVFYYAVANENISSDNRYVPNKMLVQKYKALGDENRLKILKIVKEKSLSLQELTDELKMGKTTVHHHLKILKSARFVASNSHKYAINEKALTVLPTELKLFLEDN